MTQPLPLLILTPLAAEMAPLKEALLKKSTKVSIIRHGSLQLHFFSELNVGLALGGHGKVQFAIHAQHWLLSQKWRGLICAGCAGSLYDQVKKLDLVVGLTTIEHDHIERFTQKASPRFHANAELVEAAKSFHPKDFQIHFGSIASGDEDIVDQKRATELRSSTNALCVAWEGSGGARVCRFLDIPFLELRAVSDEADKNAASDFKAALLQAMSNLSDCLIEGFL